VLWVETSQSALQKRSGRGKSRLKSKTLHKNPPIATSLTQTSLTILMRKNTRSRTAANARYRANSLSVVLPDEVIAHIFVMGCPAPNHKFLKIDTAPLQYQVLVGSICRLWRKIANECPCLWTSVVVRHPFSENKCPKKKLEFYEEMISVVLGRSGTLELDLSIRTHDVDRFSGFTPSMWNPKTTFWL